MLMQEKKFIFKMHFVKMIMIKNKVSVQRTVHQPPEEIHSLMIYSHRIKSKGSIWDYTALNRLLNSVLMGFICVECKFGPNHKLKSL